MTRGYIYIYVSVPLLLIYLVYRNGKTSGRLVINISFEKGRKSRPNYGNLAVYKWETETKVRITDRRSLVSRRIRQTDNGLSPGLSLGFSPKNQECVLS